MDALLQSHFLFIAVGLYLTLKLFKSNFSYKEYHTF